MAEGPSSRKRKTGDKGGEKVDVKVEGNTPPAVHGEVRGGEREDLNKEAKNSKRAVRRT